MQNHHLSANAAAELLERAPRTVKKALRNVPPDSLTPNGLPRWKLPTIVRALQSSGAPLIPPHHVSGNGADDELEPECVAAFKKFDQAVENLTKLPTLAQRRARAIELGNLAAEAIRKMRARDEATDLHPQHIDLRVQEVYRLMLWGFCSPCEWSKSEVWQHIVSRPQSAQQVAE